MTSVQIRFSGSGGQGLQLAAKILGAVVAADGRHISLSQSYEPTSRGGLSRADLVISEGVADYPLVTQLDYLVVLDQVAVSASDGLVGEHTVVIAEAGKVSTPPVSDQCLMLPMLEQARLAGTTRAVNIVSLGALLAHSGVTDKERLVEHIRKSVPARFVDMNIDAFERGFTLKPSGIQQDHSAA